MSERARETRKNTAVKTTSAVSLILCTISMVLKIVAAIMGKTSIQMIDCARSVVETSAVLIWWAICSERFSGSVTGQQREKLDWIIHICIIVSGVLMALFACVRFSLGITHSGKLLPGILLSAFGMIDNGIIAVMYARNKNADPEVITQRRLFTVKSCADFCVAATLTVMMAAPDFQGLAVAELISSVVVSGMMIVTGLLKGVKGEYETQIFD